MRLSAMIGALAAASLGMVGMAAASAAREADGRDVMAGLEPLHGDPENFRRGKGKQAKPRKRPNMRHVSKRVRRKHRRSL